MPKIRETPVTFTREEAREIREAYDKAWKDADVELTHSRF